MRIKNSSKLLVQGEEIHTLYNSNKKANIKSFILNRLEISFNQIEKAYLKFNKDTAINKPLPRGTDWLLDNFYFIELTYKQLKKDIKKEKRIVLNITTDGPYEGYPRIYALALELIYHSTGNITEDNIINFINEFQKGEILSLEEISYFPKYLALGLMEYIKNISLNLLKINDAWNEVDSIDLSNRENLDRIIEDIDNMDSAKVERLVRKIRDNEDNYGQILVRISQKLDYVGKSIETILEREYMIQSKYKVSLGYGITSLRNISSYNWEKVFDAIRAIEKVLKEDPIGVYEKMDSESKNYYRYNIQKLADKFNVQEITLSKKVLEFAKEEWDKGNRDKKAHVGYYLVDKGRERLFEFFGCGRPCESDYLSKLSLYIFPIIFFSIIISCLLSVYKHIEGYAYLSILIFIIVFVPIETIIINFINYCYAKKFKPKVIPKIEFKDGIPEDYATLVVIPTLLNDEERIEELARNLEVFYLSNREKNIYFGIIGDFKESNNKTTPQDESLINKGIKVIDELNKKYSSSEDIFYYFYRERVYSKTQGVWMGWERKRGALVELNKFLLGDEDTNFKVGSGDAPNIRGRIKYIITLDADTKLPIDAAKQLIGAISHPLNKAIVDEKSNIVVEGYGIIQPRILVDIDSSNKSMFTRIFAGQGGMDPYSTAISDIYQDLFGEGIFTGKGIYDLEVFQKVLDNSIPENEVLSHDLLEGSYVRTGLATDIKLVDGYPEKYISYIKRQHRWVRGDWQLIKWIIGSYGKNISRLSKWKMMENLRRSLLPIFLFLTLFIGIAFFPGNSLIWVGIVLLNLFFPLFTKAIDGLLNKGFRHQKIRLNGNLIVGYKNIFYQGILYFMFLPNEAFMMSDAIVRTIYRVYISGKNLLEWTTAFDMEKNSKNDMASYFSLMKANIIAPVLLIVLTAVFNFYNLLISIIVSLLWLSGPIIAYWISKEDSETVLVKEEDIELLRNIAEKTWKYYKEFTNSSNNYLPPDNFQEYPYNGVANRTSPTNIGFYLLSVLSSRDLGFIDTHEMVNRIRLTLDTIDKLEKWEGHLYNWYDTTNLEPLRPIFVSTVDSGNFVAYLIVLKEGLREYADDYNEKSEIEILINRIEKLIENTRFAPLYDESRNLFYIGYNVGEDKVLKCYYDLLASEARISSYIAISRREIPVKNWKMLGKSLIMENRNIGLASWSGTMFEYMMPSLVLKNYKNTLFDETYKTIINVQKNYGNRNSVPWGISESGFFAFDNQLNYQYKAFGVPSLGFKRGLKEELVVSPYSTFLALKFDYYGVMENIKRLREEGMEGPYGFYEAVDYTIKRLPAHLEKGIVKSYMSHHQGMIFAAINNFINDDILVKRFHRDPQMKCGDLLLQENIPLNPIITKEKENLQGIDIIRKPKENWEKKVYSKEDLKSIKCHLLSSGTYTLMVTNRGEGFSKNENIFVNRWRKDYLLNPYGQFIYIKNIKNNELWSAAYAPVYKEPDDYNVEFSTYKASFKRKDGEIETKMDIYLLPEELGELRRVSLVNNSEEELLIETISYFEVVGESYGSDLAHPAFSNLFIRTEALEDEEGLLAYRRKRDENQKDNWIVHGVKVFEHGEEKFQYETSRLNFVGRGNLLKNPKAIEKGLTNTIGVVLDPVMSISKKVKIPPRGKADIYYITAIAHTKIEAKEILNKYNDKNNIKLAIDLYKTKSQAEMGYINLDRSNIKPYEELLPNLFYLVDNIKSEYASIIKKNKKGKEGLWARGISGDNPIVLVTIKSMEGIGNLIKMINVHEYWSYKGINIDLVILNKDESAYYQPLYENIREEVYERRSSVVNKSGGIFIINENTLTEEDISLLYKYATIIIKAEEMLIDKKDINYKIPYKQFSTIKQEYPKRELNIELNYFNEYGGFTSDGKEYVIMISDGVNTPMPWINVIANGDFGFIITESGEGFTWSKNSRENKLTPWYNDPIMAGQGEIIYLMDEAGEIWSITPKPIRDENDYIVVHGLGYSKFHHHSNGIKQELTVFTPVNDRIKINLIKLKNESDTKRSISLYYYVRPVLGVSDEETENLLETDFNGDVFIVKNSANSEFKESTIFIGTSEKIHSYTGDRIEFLGSIPNYEKPEGLRRERLSNTVGLGYNPCAVLEVKVDILPNEEKELVFLLGEDNDLESGYSLIEKYSNIQFSENALKEVREFWEKILSKIKIETPDDTMNYMMNSWLMYQTIACRIWARAGFYQVGGAFGARDQMQDVTNALYHMPEITKKQILRNCAHQYKEGDIQHWWHPIPGSLVHKGIRSKYSDDRLWLPLGVAKYIKVTGDISILKEKIPFIESPTLKEDEEERYEVPKISDDIGTVYEHCIRAIDISLDFGERGIPLMGGGDWNDGMNKVGNRGKGESVWLGWFLATVLKNFIPVCELMNDHERANKYKDVIDQLKKSIEKNAWDGEWYKRAFFDDGTPLGSKENSECTIDSIAQSWAMISELGDEERVRLALDSLEKYLVNSEVGIVALLTPPFDVAEPNPGYIKSYVPGVRENGGQYTHAAIWVIKAFAMLGEGDKAYNLFKMINPINHSRTSIECANYKVEPYVVAADVYTNSQHLGRGGWTWYTGSSGWMYTVGLEDILGFTLEKDKLFINPCIPKDWEGFSIEYKYKNTIYHIKVKNSDKVNSGVKNIYVDDTVVSDGYVSLMDDGEEHFIVVEMGM